MIKTFDTADSKCAKCVGNRLASRSKSAQKKGFLRLIALLFPPFAFGVCLVLVSDLQRYQWLREGVSSFPWELWAIAACGTIATLGGIADWVYHRYAMSCGIGRSERRCELIALVFGGGPLFFVMAVASVSSVSMKWLLPAIVLVLFIVSMICYDEFVFHRKRCRKLETLCHRLLVFGNGFAWLAWMHWCFVRTVTNA